MRIQPTWLFKRNWRPVGGAVLSCAVPQSTGVTFYQPLLQLKVCNCVVSPHVREYHSICQSVSEVTKHYYHTVNRGSDPNSKIWMRMAYIKLNESWKYRQNIHPWYPLQSLVSSLIRLVVVTSREAHPLMSCYRPPLHIPLVLLATPDLTQI